ncbi:hypothetical protein E2C01_035411 [Portunus trituberculatus]|uniref:Uncharacterized protein n=1 Tax=Portunus trituberculatus TaxID=210409 RepID=A0A5B7F898_PORTR|nr:hypothetical protein [Portunus trituberculatus]
MPNLPPHPSLLSIGVNVGHKWLYPTSDPDDPSPCVVVTSQPIERTINNGCSPAISPRNDSRSHRPIPVMIASPINVVASS